VPNVIKFRPNEDHAGLSKFEIDPRMLLEVLAYKGMHVLVDVIEKPGVRRLRATHVCCCLVAGRNPMWAVWTAKGKFQRFYGSREEIKEAYPKQAWRKMMATWKFREIAEDDVEKRRSKLEGTIKDKK
jgi:hypothetical protein